jgi:large subunit ribosomal protein L6
MSNIGKKVIILPENLFFNQINNKILIKSNLGELSFVLLPNIKIFKENNIIKVIRTNDLKKTRSNHGLTRSILQNIILGLTKQFTISLIAEGVGYKFQIDNNYLIINVGFTHLIKMIIPTNLKVFLESATKLVITGIDKEIVGFFASRIVAIKPVEPYKGKGILYVGKTVIKKIGKRGK